MSNHENHLRSLLSDEKVRLFSGGNAMPVFNFTINGHRFAAMDRRLHGATGVEEISIVRSVRSRYGSVIGCITANDIAYDVFSDALTDAPDTPNLAELLTGRELQVATLVADGRCDKEIARFLGISTYTVREHLRRIFAKLNVCRRSAVVSKLMRQRD